MTTPLNASIRRRPDSAHRMSRTQMPTSRHAGISLIGLKIPARTDAGLYKRDTTRRNAGRGRQSGGRLRQEL